LSLHVEEGAIVAILGRNGVGKTALLRAIMGLIPCRSGRIALDGIDLTSLFAHQRARLGLAYVPQGREIFPDLTVLENLRMGARLAHDPHVTLREVLDAFSLLREKSDARGDSLSGGQQQILALGRALACRPRILLMDEPSEGIQPSLVAQLAEHIRGINARGVSVVLVEQNLEFAATLAREAYIMDKGRIVRALETAAILTDKELAREYLGV
jgi:branched-chain amino acid transport system ATP-binding protein/urea transport system ATP-binding protein